MRRLRNTQSRRTAVRSGRPGSGAAAAAAAVLAAVPFTAAWLSAGAASATSTASAGGPAHPAKMAAAGEPYTCTPNGPPGSQTIYGTFGDASVLGWTGNPRRPSPAWAAASSWTPAPPMRVRAAAAPPP